MPLSLVTEYLVRGAAWLFSPGYAQDHDQELRDLRVRPPTCNPADGPLRLIRRATVTGSGQHLRIEVGLWRVTDAGESLAGTCSISPWPDAAAESDAVLRPAAVAEPGGRLVDTPARAPSAAYRWQPYDVEVGRWAADGWSWLTQVNHWWSTDMFTLIEPPEPALPLAHLEALAAVSPAAALGACVWTAKRARWRRSAGRARSVTVAGDARHATVFDDTGRQVLSIEGASWSPEMV
jgi:hypothetical protein